MSDDVFLTNGAPGYLEYAGTSLRKCVAIDARPGNLERWRRLDSRRLTPGSLARMRCRPKLAIWLKLRRVRVGLLRNNVTL